MIESGSRLAVIGENGVGKSTLLKCLVNELEPLQGTIKWSDNASIGYCPQDTERIFINEIKIIITKKNTNLII